MANGWWFCVYYPTLFVNKFGLQTGNLIEHRGERSVIQILQHIDLPHGLLQFSDTACGTRLNGGVS